MTERYQREKPNCPDCKHFTRTGVMNHCDKGKTVTLYTIIKGCPEFERNEEYVRNQGETYE